MRDIYGCKRLIARYERMMDGDIRNLTQDSEFHIEQLTNAISELDKLLDIIGDEIADWAEAISVLYVDMDEPDTIWSRIQLVILRWYVNRRYAKVLDESVEVMNCKTSLEKIRNRLLILMHM